MTQISMFGGNVSARTGQPPVMIVNGSVEDLMPWVAGARLVLADPPWEYTSTGIARRDMGNNYDGRSIPHYTGLAVSQISSVLARSYDCAADEAYLLLWITWPILADWLSGRAVLDLGRWHILTGGAWGKIGGLGIGFHTRGDSEPYLLCKKGSARPHRHDWSNLYLDERGQHSAKPVGFTRKAIRALTAPGDMVLSLFVGLGNDAVAAKHEGRAFIGAELDAERCRLARERVGVAS